jgi:hypothetical protein
MPLGADVGLCVSIKEGKMVAADEKLSTIKDYVRRERSRQGIHNVDRTTKSEMSGESFGEIVMLLDRQLMTTEIGYGSWDELNNIEVLEAVYLLVRSRQVH